MERERGTRREGGTGREAGTGEAGRDRGREVLGRQTGREEGTRAGINDGLARIRWTKEKCPIREFTVCSIHYVYRTEFILGR